MNEEHAAAVREIEGVMRDLMAPVNLTHGPSTYRPLTDPECAWVRDICIMNPTFQGAIASTALNLHIHPYLHGKIPQLPAWPILSVAERMKSVASFIGLII